MAGDDSRGERREFSFDNVEVGAADSAGEDAEEEVAGSGSRDRDVLDC